ncbi:MAG: LysR family transcriptional regulator [Acidobacteria bacterium]|nr:LysR family transcriptional regulator [Acidobacteriota bacterium]
MLRNLKRPLPRMSALRAFEAAARHESFTAAADELGIRQPAVSRLIAELEQEVDTPLFERSRRGVILSPAGVTLQRAVTIGLDRIAAGALSAASVAEDRRVIVACGHATSYLFVMPRFGALRRELGDNVCLRILTVDFDTLERLGGHEVDLLVAFDQAARAPGDQVEVFREAVRPVCSPGFATSHAEALARPVEAWGSLPLLRLARPARTWATWHDWFESVGRPPPRPRYVDLSDYVCLLEAAVAGQGVALGWRHLVDRHLDEGRLVAVSRSFVEFDRNCYARLTERGRARPDARRCLDALGALANSGPRASGRTRGT